MDLRDVRELKREGGIPGAFHCPRGLLEFWIDPESPYHHAVFAEPKEFVFFCNLGWRSALAADIAQQMGLRTSHIDGGFEAIQKSSELRKDSDGQDWYESRKDRQGRKLLMLSTKKIGGNRTHKAMIKAHPELNTYLSHRLTEPQDLVLSATFDIYIREILPDDNRSAFIMLGGLKDKKGGPKIGLALAGGGPLGGIYEIGALLALNEAIDGLDFADVDVYVGVSAGSFVASTLANGITVEEMGRLLVSRRGRPQRFDPALIAAARQPMLKVPTSAGTARRADLPGGLQTRL